MVSKKIFFKIHSWVGVNLSILLFVVCFSGTLAVFSHELDWLFNPEMRAKPATELASRNLIAANIEKEFPNSKITFWMRAKEDYLTDIIYLENAKYKFAFVNQYTGEVQGASNLTIQRFLRDFHYYLFIPDQIGNYIVLIFGFVLSISLITAIFYYQDWYKNLFVLKTGKGSNAFYSSLHKLLGAWSIPFTALICLTGIWYFVERTDFPKISPFLNVDVPKVTGEDLPKLDYDTYVEIAEAEIPGLVVKNIIPPFSRENAVYLTGTSNEPLVRYRANRVYINPHNNEVLKVQNAEKINNITWLNDIADPLHFGNWGGLITKSIWFVFGLCICALTLTGPWLFLKREIKLKKLKKQRRLGHG